MLFLQRVTKTIVSGHSETKRVKQALELGVSEYVRKPCMPEKIGTVIRKTLSSTQ